MSIESRFAASTKLHVLTTTASASSASSTMFQPAPVSRAASSSESTSLRAHPRVTIETLRWFFMFSGPPAESYGWWVGGSGWDFVGLRELNGAAGWVGDLWIRPYAASKQIATRAAAIAAVQLGG